MKQAVSLLGFFVFLAVVGVVSAQNATDQTTQKTPVSVDRQTATTVQDHAQGSVKERALAAIDRRITSLTNLITRLAGLVRLSETQQASLTEDIQGEVTALTTLRGAIEAETDETVIREKSRTIVTSFRTYAVYIPQIHLIAAAESILNVVERFENVIALLQTRIDALSEATDTTQIDSLMSQLTQSVAAMERSANSILSTTLSLNPAGYPGNRAQIATLREQLANLREDITTARGLVRQILTLLQDQPLPVDIPDTNQTGDAPVTSTSDAPSTNTVPQTRTPQTSSGVTTPQTSSNTSQTPSAQ